MSTSQKAVPTPTTTPTPPTSKVMTTTEPPQPKPAVHAKLVEVPSTKAAHKMPVSAFATKVLPESSEHLDDEDDNQFFFEGDDDVMGRKGEKWGRTHSPALEDLSPQSYGGFAKGNPRGGKIKTYLFEVAWEVARKVGGIYTVLSSKAAVTVREWGDKFALIGPYSAASAPTEFEPLPASDWVEKLLEALQRRHNIKVHFGRWLVKGYPLCFLIDINSSKKNLAQWRAELHDGFEVPCDDECNNVIIFGYQVALFFQEAAKIVKRRKFVAHFHEWMAGVGLIVLKRWQLPVATVFTTHATLLGRWMAAGNVDLYEALRQGFDTDAEAAKRLIYHKHWIEVGAARGAEVFTTVSDVTAYEAAHILHREPDVITPNGLNVQRFAVMHQFQNLHKTYKDVIAEFCRGHFYGCYDFDMENTLFFFTSGRHEYRNKGVDLWIESLAELNYRLKKENPHNITVVALIIMPGQTNNYNVESIRGQSVRRQIRETINSVQQRVSDRLYEKIMHGDVCDEDLKRGITSSLMTEEDIVMLKRHIQVVKQAMRTPPIVTHNMVHDADDDILNHIRRCELFNKPEDRVKVIYHPEFLNATNPLIPLDYPDFVRGCHLGVFPSYYEPWGYTPAECILSGIPTVTSDLTGFANYVASHMEDDLKRYGVYIVERREKSFDDSKRKLATIMHMFCKKNRRERIEQRNRVESLAPSLDWETLGKYYYDARNMAVQRAYGVELDKPHFFL